MDTTNSRAGKARKRKRKKPLAAQAPRTRGKQAPSLNQKEGIMSALEEALQHVHNDQNKLIELVTHGQKPPATRAKVLNTALHAVPPPQQEVLLTQLLEHCQANGAANRLKELYEQTLIELENGPARPATFIKHIVENIPGPKPKAHVISPDGQERYPMLHPDIKGEDLVRGMTVFVDPKCVMVLGYEKCLPSVGQEATFLRGVDDDLVEISLRDERFLVYGSQAVLDAVAAGTVKNGDRVLLSPQRYFAFRVVPAETDRRHRFVDYSQVPEIIAGRDIGKPHWVLGYLIKRTRILMFRPDLRQRFDLRPRVAVFLSGPTGTGKTLTIKAFQFQFYQMLVERTGRKDLGSRTIRVKPAELLSEWLGQSDKNIERLFDDIRALAGEEIETVDGEKVQLPVVVIIEEGEGLTRRRGEFDSGVYDRILGTMLQRLDDPNTDLGRLPLVLITSSNRPELMDSAMWRRLSGVRANYSRLDRDGLASVLGKKLKPHYPYASVNGYSAEQLRGTAIDQIVGNLYSPNGTDQGLIEVTFRDGKKATKHRRDFLTGAIVEQAVANAIDQAAFAAEEGHDDAGLSAGWIIDALQRLIDGLAENFTAHNVHDYVDLPDNVQVASLRRLRQANGSLTSVIAS
ncbi:MAG: AAA family ATPase [Planctomycetes bacterium]|nr:AAA family ATPase [Planctomycetota bacterium]